MSAIEIKQLRGTLIRQLRGILILAKLGPPSKFHCLQSSKTIPASVASEGDLAWLINFTNPSFPYFLLSNAQKVLSGCKDSASISVFFQILIVCQALLTQEGSKVMTRGKGPFKNPPIIVRIYLQYPFMSSNHLLEELYEWMNTG